MIRKSAGLLYLTSVIEGCTYIPTRDYKMNFGPIREIPGYENDETGYSFCGGGMSLARSLELGLYKWSKRIGYRLWLTQEQRLNAAKISNWGDVRFVHFFGGGGGSTAAGYPPVDMREYYHRPSGGGSYVIPYYADLIFNPSQNP